MACVVSNPDVEFLSAACEIGVMVLAVCDLVDVKKLQRRLRDLAAWPAVIATSIALPAAEIDRSCLGGLLLASTCGDGDFVFKKTGSAEPLSAGHAKPVIVTCDPAAESPSGLRRACEELQAKMAPQDFAGFAAIQNESFQTVSIQTK